MGTLSIVKHHPLFNALLSLFYGVIGFQIDFLIFSLKGNCCGYIALILLKE